MLTTAALKNKLKEHLTREKIDKIENFDLRIFYTNRVNARHTVEFARHYSTCNKYYLERKFQNFTIAYGANGVNIGLIRNFYKINNQVYLIVQKFQKTENLVKDLKIESALNKYFLICDLTSEVKLIKIEEINRKCVFSYYNNKFNISIFNNMIDS